MTDEPTPIEHRLSGDELDTIIAVANNEQTGRLTRWEVETLVEAYLDLKLLKREYADLQRRFDWMVAQRANVKSDPDPMFPQLEISAPNLQVETPFEFAKRLRAALKTVTDDANKIYYIEMDVMRHANHPQRMLDAVRAYVWVR